MRTTSVPNKTLSRRALGRGLIASFLLHAVALAVVAVALKPTSPPAPSINVVAGFAASSAPTRATVEGVHLVTETSKVTGDLVQSRIETLIAKQQTLQPARQLERLDRIMPQLARVSSENSLDDLATQFQSWFGYRGRAAEPIGPAEPGTFDPDTAQMYDVSRHGNADGSWRYVSVLLDAQGRTIELELSAQEGVALYELMQRLKASPLLAKLYRQIAMPLLDQLLESSVSEIRSTGLSPAGG